MDKKVLIQDVTTLLSARLNITKKAAEGVFRSFFDIIAEGLIRDKYVRIKGFGTFKIIVVGERESVNIKTGERFQIDSHTKVSFTPDAFLKDLVNRPFSEFKTTILNEGVNEEVLDAADKTKDNLQPQEDITEREETASVSVPSAAKETEEEVKVEDEHAEVSEEETKMLIPEIVHSTTMSEAVSKKEDKEINTPQASEEARNEAPKEVEPGNATSEIPVSVCVPQEEKMEVAAVAQEATDAEISLPSVQPHPRPWKRIATFSFIVIIIIGVVGAILYLQKNKSPEAQAVQQTNSVRRQQPATQTQTADATAQTATQPRRNYTILLMQGVPEDAAKAHVEKMKKEGYTEAEVTKYNGNTAIVYGYYATYDEATAKWRELKDIPFFKNSLPATVKEESKNQQ